MPVATFARLGTVGRVTFHATSAAPSITGWVGTGVGTVAVDRPDPATVIWHERGTWTPAAGRPTAFANAYRWTLAGDRLALDHLRFGPGRPVVLFDLVPAGPAAFRSADPHACRADRYAAELTWDADAVRLVWTITGPDKAERIEYIYA